jgi:hypothetical protein
VQGKRIGILLRTTATQRSQKRKRHVKKKTR